MKNDLRSIIEENKKLVYKIASKFSKYYCIEDLFQVGVIGLIKAHKNYKEGLSAKFSTYAYTYILGEMLEYTKNDRTIKLNSDVLKFYKVYEKTYEHLTQKNGRIPTFSEIAAFMKIEEKTLYEIIASSEFVLSLDNEINNEVGNYYDVIGNDNREKVDDLICLREEYNKLNYIDREIIRCRYYKDYTQSETARYLGISQVQVSRYEQKALTRIREKMTA